MKNLNFKKLRGLIPAVIQEEGSKEILMVGFMNAIAFQKTCEEGIVYFWSRTKRKLWKKGEVSGNVLFVKKLQVDCDEDTILITVASVVAACHTGSKSCFMKYEYK